MSRRNWTTEEDNYIKINFGLKTYSEMAKHIGCSITTITKRAEDLGLNVERKTTKRWTTEEENLLKEYSKKYITKTIAKKLGRSILSVQKKAIKLGIELHSERDPWKKWMIDYLKDNINKKPIGEIEKMLGLSYHRIITKCNELGIEYIKENWTEEEISILRKYAQTCHYTELTKVLPRRTVGAITAKAYELGIETISDYKKLTAENLAFIKENWGKMPVTEIARQLKTSVGHIYRYKKELGLPNVGQQKKWMPKIIEKIRKDAKTLTRNELAKKYKTSPGQISTLAGKHNITLIDTKKVWTEQLDNELTMLVLQKLSIPDIAKKMNMKAGAIRERITKLGLNDKKAKNPNHKWTKEEVTILRNLSAEKTTHEIAELLNKTEKQVYEKAKQMKLKYNRGNKHLWSEEESKQLFFLHDKYDAHIIAQVMERSEGVIKEKAKELGLKLKHKPRQTWSIEEENQLVIYVKELTVNEIAYLLNRSVASVTGKLKYMGLLAQRSPRFWSEEEIEQLLSLSKNHNVNEIATIMNKTYESISYKLMELGLKAKNKSNKPWTEEETTELLELLTTYSSFEVAEILDRSEEAIIVKAIKMGYEVNKQHRKWTIEEETELKDLWGNISTERIAKKLNRTVSSIINRAHLLGLGPQIDNNFDGLKIQDIADIFLVNRNTILTSWVSLGLKLSFRRRSNNSVYSFVTITNLFDFLEKNQNLWDGRNLEENILGEEPEWLKNKRKRDIELNQAASYLGTLTKQQLIQARKYFFNSQIQSEETEEENCDKTPMDNDGPKLTKKNNN